MFGNLGKKNICQENLSFLNIWQE